MPLKWSKEGVDRNEVLQMIFIALSIDQNCSEEEHYNLMDYYTGSFTC